MFYVQLENGNELKIYWKHYYPRTLKNIVREEQENNIPKKWLNSILPYFNVGYGPYYCQALVKKALAFSDCYILYWKNGEYETTVDENGNPVTRQIWNNLGTGTTCCSLSDFYDKESARVKSLKYAIEDSLTANTANDIKINIGDKKRIWDSYFNRNKTRNNKTEVLSVR